jgi:hypothetical protein
MMKSRLATAAAALFIAACGGGGGGNPVAVASIGSLSVGHACNSDEDTMPGMSFIVPDVDRPHGCTTSTALTHDGTRSLRFEVRPGDCYGQDCTTDRRRFEIYDSLDTIGLGKTVVYDTFLYIPEQPNFKPRGSNALFLAQLNLRNYRGLYHTLAYLEIGNDQQLMLRTHQGFTWAIKDRPVLATGIFDRWIKVTYEVRASTTDGWIKVWVNDILAVEERGATLQTSEDFVALKIGIYNAFVSQATQAYGNQVIHYDGIRRTVR